MARTLKLTLAYDGTAFVGWQRQATGVSIQGLLEDALSKIEGRPVTVFGAGRTDAGVHALGQVASASVDHPMALGVLQRALNAVLPPDVRVVETEEARPGFHARYDARAKTYQYAIMNGLAISPFEWRYAWHVTQALDVDAMAQAARCVVGRRDFAAFASSGSVVKTTVRTMTTSEVRLAGPGEPRWARSEVDWPSVGPRRVMYEIAGDGFLRQMVRAIVGTLVEVGCGRLDAGEMERILASGDRKAAGATAPGHGLCLVAVDYGMGDRASAGTPLEPTGLRVPELNL
jgi:tRNA pseudouridine38-40 synthase